MSPVVVDLGARLREHYSNDGLAKTRKQTCLTWYILALSSAQLVFICNKQKFARKGPPDVTMLLGNHYRVMMLAWTITQENPKIVGQHARVAQI